MIRDGWKHLVWNLDRSRECRLLRRCAADDAAAQKQFARESYMRQILRTATETNLRYNRILDPQEIDELCRVLTVEIYESYRTLPHWRHDLYRRIHQYVRRAVEIYIRHLHSGDSI